MAKTKKRGRNSYISMVVAKIKIVKHREAIRSKPKEMYPEFDVEDFINLPNYKIYLNLMIDRKPSRPFSGNISLIH
jgi:hypothetical protein